MNPAPVLAFIFWACLVSVIYTYLVYPVLIRAFSRWAGRPETPPVIAVEDLPVLSLLIAAHNEEEVIAETLGHALALDYPPDRLEIVVASDGSTDGTARIVEGLAGQGVRLLDYPENRGKACVLNASIPGLKGEIVLLSDANTRIDPQAARRLVRWFRDPEVGTVCGRLVLIDSDTGRNVDSLYWKYETFLKRSEARLGALLGANGAIYAIRKSVYVPIPEGTIVDDFVIPLLARLRTDCLGVYDAEALAYEETAPDIGSEFRRRARIGAGGFQSLGVLWRLLNPRHGWVAFSYFSHKVLRWLGPFFLLAILATNLALLAKPFYRWMLAGQIAFYLTSWLATFLPAGARAAKMIRLTTMFTGMNVALFVGFCRWASGAQRGTWRRTSRSSGQKSEFYVSSTT